MISIPESSDGSGDLEFNAGPQELELSAKAGFTRGNTFFVGFFSSAGNRGSSKFSELEECLVSGSVFPEDKLVEDAVRLLSR